MPHINLGLSYDRQCENGKLFLPPFNPFEEFERKGETGTTSVLSVNVKYTIKYLLLTFLVFFFQGLPLQEENKKRKQQNLVLGPQAGVYIYSTVI